MKTTMFMASACLLFASQPVLAQPDDDLGGFEEDAPEPDPQPEAEPEPEFGAEAEIGAEPGGAAPGGAPARSFGWGVTRSMAGYTGASIEYHLSDKLMLEAIFGLAFNSPDMGDSTVALVIAPGAFYSLASGSNTAFMIGGRLGFGTVTGDNSATQINIEVPARVQWYMTDRLALHLETGLVVAIIDDSGPVLDPLGVPDSTDIKFGASMPFGAAGFTLYWP